MSNDIDYLGDRIDELEARIDNMGDRIGELEAWQKATIKIICGGGDDES